MLPAGGALEQARKARDPRFDGRFFVGVRTTGIYCRPVCAVKMPRAENVTFFDSAAAATEAGYRPCLRCRPEASPGTPAWQGTSTTVRRALKLIDDGALDQGGIESLSDRLGVTSRHLNRLFRKHVGATPKTIAKTRRLQFAKRLIDETRLPMTEIAMSAGYGSIRRFNDHIKQTYDRSPTSLRQDRETTSPDSLTLRLPYRQPYDFDGILDFFAIRATPGVEAVDTGYTRTFLLDGEAGRIRVADNVGDLECTIEGGSSRSLMTILQKV
ncbi:MAG: DNA-3-methyladenine glycosylase 2 family protein, partial [Gammaproteobacteria bacterium]|nr:DNA-3-methyladenine glycosylase 2 family protein [Gammaproteobacteria bacterium]